MKNESGSATFENSHAEWVGITIGVLAQAKENYSAALYSRTKDLVHMILQETEYSVLLIPHIRGEFLGDVDVLKGLREYFNDARVKFAGENRADIQKTLIANCKMIVTVRTHVSIAAYSCCVPTLVIGYSQKSMGIARDLFGTDENYVINLSDACAEGKLIKAFKWLNNNCSDVKAQLNHIIPTYNEKLSLIPSTIVEVDND